MVVFPGLLVSAIVFVAAGRILLGCFPGNHATKNNLFAVTSGAFLGAGIFMVLVMWVAAVLHISLKPRDENTVAIVSWMIGGLMANAIVAWLITRPRPPRKGISG
jgi:hypothetical protein